MDVSKDLQGAVTKGEVRGLLLTNCADGLALVGLEPAEVPDDFDLRENGVLDSLGFLELVTAIEDALQIELDFDDLDPEQLTTVGPLARHIAVQATAEQRAA